MLQFDPEIFPLAHGTIHITTVGDFDLHLPWPQGNIVAESVDGFFEEFYHLSLGKWATKRFAKALLI